MGRSDRPMPAGGDGRVRWWMLVPWWHVAGLVAGIAVLGFLSSPSFFIGILAASIVVRYRRRRAAEAPAPAADRPVARPQMIGARWTEPAEAAWLLAAVIALSLVVNAIFPSGEPEAVRPAARVALAALLLAANAAALVIVALRDRRRRI